MLVLRKHHWYFGAKLAKVGMGSQNYNADFVKPTLYNILFNVFNWRYQTYSRKEIQNLFYFLRDCLGEVG